MWNLSRSPGQNPCTHVHTANGCFIALVFQNRSIFSKTAVPIFPCLSHQPGQENGDWRGLSCTLFSALALSNCFLMFHSAQKGAEQFSVAQSFPECMCEVTELLCSSSESEELYSSFHCSPSDTAEWVIAWHMLQHHMVPNRWNSFNRSWGRQRCTPQFCLWRETTGRASSDCSSDICIQWGGENHPELISVTSVDLESTKWYQICN